MATDPAAPATQQKNTVRTIYRLSLRREGAILKFEVESNGFLYKMVRNIIGTLLAVGQGKREPNEVKKILQARSRPAAGSTAPACGLCLIKVRY